MNRIIMTAWIIAILVWVFYLVIFLISFTDLLSGGPMKEFRLVFGLGLLIFTGLIVISYQKQIKHQKDMKNPSIKEF